MLAMAVMGPILTFKDYDVCKGNDGKSNLYSGRFHRKRTRPVVVHFSLNSSPLTAKGASLCLYCLHVTPPQFEGSTRRHLLLESSALY